MLISADRRETMVSGSSGFVHSQSPHGSGKEATALIKRTQTHPLRALALEEGLPGAGDSCQGDSVLVFLLCGGRGHSVF